MSYPWCQAVGMKSDDVTEPADANLRELRESLGEWAAISSEMLELLHETVGCDRSRNWRPHCSQIVAAVDAFRERCRDEAEEVGCWRLDGLDADDAFERVREQGNRLVEWLQRMMAE